MTGPRYEGILKKFVRFVGLLAGKFVTPPSIFEADHEIEEMFYGNDS